MTATGNKLLVVLSIAVCTLLPGSARAQTYPPAPGASRICLLSLEVAGGSDVRKVSVVR